MEIEEIIENFGEKFGLNLELDETRSCNFSVDDIAVTITILDEVDTVALIGDIGSPPEFDREKLYRLLLEANYLYNATHGATLSLNEDNGHVCLSRYLPAALLDPEKLYLEVETFINVADTWVTVMRDLGLAGSESTAQYDQNERTSTDFIRNLSV